MSSLPWDPQLTDSSILTDLRRLTGGMILTISASGPALAKRDGPRSRPRRGTFVPALRRLDRVVIALYSLAWLACLTGFWAWWLEPAHRVGAAGIAVNSAVLIYVSGFPVFFVLAANRLRKINPEIALPALRVAFAVTRAPSEPWELVRSTLSAMLDQDFPYAYDVWLCDEKPTPEIFAWCASKGIKVSSRNGVAGYHRDSWPRRAACKEGNLAYFYDQWGYRSYDVVAQLDSDHKPGRAYLAEMVRPFADPAIGYVAAPSVCDANAGKSWAARGRVHKEATFHGPFQLGHGDGLSPLCIGSHYAVRTRALREIGGLGPDLAEDFSTTFLLNSAGWHGAFAIDAEAHGDGPNTFAAMGVQEFQWSRSLTTIMLGLVPRHLRHLPWVLRLRFIYALSYYVLLAITTLGGLALAPVAAVTGLPWMNVNYLGFLAHWWSISIWLLLIVHRLRGRRLLRPAKAPLVSWESWLYSLTRWPYVCMGVCAAALYRLRPKTLTFKVTPKAVDGLEPLPARAVMPFFAISVLCSAAAIAGEFSTNALGYVFLSLAAGATYAIVAVAVPLLHAREAAAGASVPFVRSLWGTIRAPLLMALVALAPICVGGVLYPAYLAHTLGGLHSGIHGLDIHHLVMNGFGRHAFGF